MRNDNNAYGYISCILGFIWTGFFSSSSAVFYFWQQSFIYAIGFANIFVFPALAIVFGIVGTKKDKKRILSGIGLGLGIFIVAVMLLLIILNIGFT